jgi:Raf kinase inhibitor-like YbhB/YbcL family protein
MFKRFNSNILSAAAALALSLIACQSSTESAKEDPRTQSTNPTFVLSSASFPNNGAIPLKHYWNQLGCTGDNISPELSWRGAPEGTKSFAITLYDPDAQTGGGFWHWVAYNIPADVTALPEGSTPGKMPAGTVEGDNDLGAPGWFGSCPLVGFQDRYIYTLYALKTEKLELPAGASAAYIGFNLNGNMLAKAVLIGTAGPRK